MLALAVLLGEIGDELRSTRIRGAAHQTALNGRNGSSEEPQRCEQIAAGACDAVHVEGCKCSSWVRFKRFLLRCITIGGATGG